MGRTVAELRALREQLTRRRWQAANAVTDDLDGAGLDNIGDSRRRDLSTR